MSFFRVFTRLGTACFACFSLLQALPAWSQANTPMLEEIIVSAQKREESLQDVSVSVSVLSGEKMTDAGIGKIEDLAPYVPNLVLSETGIGTNIYIRGIGSGINQGFEQSVGMYVDGIYYGRAQLTRAPFLDLERFEVLRGSQSTLFGKNSIAGALSLTTARPGDEFESSVSVLVGEDDERELTYIISGPLTDVVAARLAYRSKDIDGYIRNTTLLVDEPEREEETLRLTLDWQAGDDTNVVLKLEQNEFNVIGRQVEIIGDQPSLNPAFGGQNYGEIMTNLFGQSATALDSTQDYRRSSNGDFSNNDTDNATLIITQEYENFTLTSTTGYLQYDYSELCDCDFTGADVFTVASMEDYEQLSQEFRIDSGSGEVIEYMAGLYYQDSELDFNDVFGITEASAVGPALNLIGPLVGLPGAGTAVTTNGLLAPRNFEQDTELWSVFLQVTWNISDFTRLILGGRYTDEEKAGIRQLSFTDNDGNLKENPAVDLPIYAAFFAAQPHDLSGERDESKFSPLVILEQDVNEDLMVYLSYTEGFKSGGFDARSNVSPTPGPLFGAIQTGLVGSFEYSDEEAESAELGAKATLLDGAGELNIAYFYTEYKDLQVSIFDGQLGFNVGNAAEAVNQGVEIDSRWALTEELTINASLAYLDFEFKDFNNGQCVQGQAANAADGRSCSFGGRSNQYVANWSGAVSADYEVPVSDEMRFKATLDVLYHDDYHPTQNLDDRIKQDAYTKLNLRLALIESNDTWELAILGRNLTDEEVISYANDTPLSFGLFQSVGWYGFVERPRSVAVQGTYNF